MCTRVRSLTSFLRCLIAITPIAPPVAIVRAIHDLLLLSPFVLLCLNTSVQVYVRVVPFSYTLEKF